MVVGVCYFGIAILDFCSLKNRRRRGIEGERPTFYWQLSAKKVCEYLNYLWLSDKLKSSCFAKASSK